MTRATLYLITNNKVLHSCEFNGDGYPSGYGQDYIAMLEKTKTEADFKKHILSFNKKNFSYSDRDLFYETPIKKKIKKLNENCNAIEIRDDNYFEEYFSDWCFFKNLSDKKIMITTIENSFIELGINEQVAINFGHIDGHFKTLEQCKKMYDIA